MHVYTTTVIGQLTIATNFPHFVAMGGSMHDGRHTLRL